MSEFWEQHYPRAWGSWILYPNCLAYLVCLSDTELPPSDLGISRQVFQRAWGWGRGSHVGSAPTGTKRLTELSLCKWYTALANYRVVESFRVRQMWGLPAVRPSGSSSWDLALWVQVLILPLRNQVTGTICFTVCDLLSSWGYYPLVRIIGAIRWELLIIRSHQHTCHA